MFCLLCIDAETVNDAIEDLVPELIKNEDMRKFLEYLKDIDWKMDDEWERINDEIRAHYLIFKKES